MARVFYVTNRNPDDAANPTSFGSDFNGTQPGALTYGVADVASPSGHDAQGLPFEAAQSDVKLSLNLTALCCRFPTFDRRRHALCYFLAVVDQIFKE